MNWRTIAEFPNHEVSDCGIVRNARTGRVKAQQENNVGLPYKAVSFNDSFGGVKRSFRRTVHRLVAQAFVPNPHGLPVVRHLDGDCTNNRADNLAWGTMTDNATDAIKHGTAGGKRRQFVIMEGRMVGDEILARHAAGKSGRQIALSLGLHQSSVAKFIRRHANANHQMKEAA